MYVNTDTFCLVTEDLSCQLVSFGRKQEISLAWFWYERRLFSWQSLFRLIRSILGDNIRVLDWVIRRVNGEDIAEPSPVGLLPKIGSINLQGLIVDWDKLMSVPKEYWKNDIDETFSWLDGQLGEDLPQDIRTQIEEQKQRISQMD